MEIKLTMSTILLKSLNEATVELGKKDKLLRVRRPILSLLFPLALTVW